jgi:hypothetical protein
LLGTKNLKKNMTGALARICFHFFPGMAGCQCWIPLLWTFSSPS